MSNENARFSPWLSIRSAPVFVQRALGDDEACVFMVKAANEISVAASKIEKVVAHALGNQLGSELANARDARKAIDKLAAPTLKSVAAAVERANAAIEMLTAKTNPQMPENVATALMHHEVLTALQRMTDAERRKAIATAISSGDETFLAAATSGSPVLSGMTAAEQSVTREQWRSKRHPDITARIVRLRKGLAQLDRLGPMFKKWADQLVKEPAPEVVDASAIELTATGAKLRLDGWDGKIFTMMLASEGKFSSVAANLGPLPLGFAQFLVDKDGRQDVVRLTFLPPGQVYELRREPSQ